MAVELRATRAARADGGSLRMSMAEIADLAGVKRPVVSTWRRRYSDFPAPVDGDALELQFDSRQVAEWLAVTGRDREGRIEADLSLHTLAGLRAGLRANDLIALVTALICSRSLDDVPLADGGGEDVIASLARRAAELDPEDTCLRSEVSLLPPDAQWLAVAVDALVEAAWGCPQAFERIMGARTQFKAGDIYARTITPGLAKLIAELSGARERARERTITVWDPAAGPGDLLVAVADAIGPDYQPVYQVAEADPYLARLTARRLLVHGVPWDDFVVATSEGIPDGWDDPDVIVTQIPYEPGETRSTERVIDRLDEIALRLAPGCTAVVLGPAGALVEDLTPYSQAERARAKLLSSGMVEAVIRLPGGLVPYRSGYEVGLWVLTSAYESRWRGRVLLADVSDRDLTGDVIAALAEDVVTWRRDGYRPHAHTRAFSVQKNVADLVDPPRPLSARRSATFSRAGTAGADWVSRVTELEAELAHTAHPPAERLPIRSGAATGRGGPPPTQTVSSLAKARRLIIRPGARLPGIQLDEDGHFDVVGTPELLGRGRRGERKMDRVALAGHPRVQLTEPGDVIVTTTPGFGVIVDHEGFAVAEFPAKVLRIPGGECQSFTPRTLAALLAGRIPSLRRAGAIRAARRLEDRELPLLSPAEVTFLDHLLTQIDSRRQAAQQELDLLAELRDLATSGVIDGTLTFVTPPSTPTGQ